ncbi:hypothetical protein GVN21_15575 [Caulobacter sp. SLTY]|uniref:hypothetical protein n=1 Tax=Caulobacter sp. SLTY TaxID=2683262 RepID=UPI00141353D8|nr:hypothetical protein [Caulobacter sp. SLTY]NBB16784.1 hypothetical protein [Caulobacter sp. SLTY]
MTVQLSSLLKRTLGLDAATCLAMGAAMTLGALPLGDLTGLPPALLMVAGLVLFPVAGLMIWLARRNDAPAPMLWLVIGGNAGWVAASLLLLVGGWVKPTLAGEIFVIVQALGVVALTLVEYAGVRQGRPAMA